MRTTRSYTAASFFARPDLDAIFKRGVALGENVLDDPDTLGEQRDKDVQLLADLAGELPKHQVVQILESRDRLDAAA